MDKELIALLTQSKKLSPKLRKIAEYIVENPMKVIHSSITDLAEMTNCSETTIFRLCKELQFKGFQDLKISLAKDIIETPTQDIHEEMSNKDSTMVTLNKVFQAHIKGFQDTMNLIDERDFEHSVALLSEANRIEFYGSGGSSIIALDAYHKFMRTGISCAAHTDSHFQAMSVCLLSAGDVVVAISHSGRNKVLMDVLSLAKENNVTIIGVTSYYKSPLSKVSDITLYTPTSETKLRPEASSSRLAQLALIDALHLRVSLQREEDAMKNLQNIRKSISIQRL